MTKATTPQLRFREFTQDWQQQKLDATFTLISGQHLLPSEYSTDSGEVPYFAGPLDFTDDKKAIKKWAIYPSKIALNGDVLITVKGSGVGVLWFLILPKVAIGRQLMAIRGSGGSTTLLFHLLSTKRQRFQALAAGNMIPGLSRGDILQMPLSLPTTEEQRKIAAVFSAVDAKLDALRALLP